MVFNVLFEEPAGDDHVVLCWGSQERVLREGGSAPMVLVARCHCATAPAQPTPCICNPENGVSSRHGLYRIIQAQAHWMKVKMQQQCVWCGRVTSHFEVPSSVYKQFSQVAKGRPIDVRQLEVTGLYKTRRAKTKYLNWYLEAVV